MGHVGGIGGAALPLLGASILLRAPLAKNWSLISSALESDYSTLLVIVPDRRSGERLVSDLRFYLGDTLPESKRLVYHFFSWEILPFEDLSPTIQDSAERLAALHQIQAGDGSIIVATADSFLQKIITPQQYLSLLNTLHAGSTYQREDLLRHFIRAGYHRSTLVEEYGDLAVRGSVIDFYPPASRYPVRLEFFDDQLESIRYFDPETQRSLRRNEQIDVLPVAELPFIGHGDENKNEAIKLLRARASHLNISHGAIEHLEEAIKNNSGTGLEKLQGLFNPQTATLCDYITEKTLVISYDEDQIRQNLEDYYSIVCEQAQKAEKDGRIFPEISSAYSNPEATWTELSSLTNLKLSSIKWLDNDENSSALAIKDQSELKTTLAAYRSNDKPLTPLIDLLRRSQDRHICTAIVVSQPQRSRRFSEILTGYGIKTTEFSGNFFVWLNSESSHRQSDKITLLSGIISAGIIDDENKFQLIYESDVFPELLPRRKGQISKNIRRLLGSLSQLNKGDYIVHADHGIGLYHGLVQIIVEGKLGDFLHLEYAEGAKLYLPVENIGKVEKYAGVEGKTPALTKLGSGAWTKTKAKVEKQVAELAGQLINLYAQREIVAGVPFGDLNDQDLQFADAFCFEETPDQAKAIEDVLSDMAKSKPMDRLVCGDVGYGKTEVGLRAAFKAINAGKQVAFLVPTTVLADQHFQTFKERFSGFPVNVGCVSRFFSKEDIKKTLADLARGAVDIIIGTHRLIQKDVFFSNLGLVIVDEEHRFGVAHKERLKQLRKEVDVLTLTATPIPRTLHMSLAGIRDLSVIETPPCDRQVIKTYLAPYEPNTVRQAILRELSRQGQVFYINNRVQNIAMICQEVRELVPEARVAFGHGQMNEAELNRVMHRFINKEIDVLVSTTIVESGLDIPNANTIIIRRAENFGLAELYQLRGRVGRSSRRAYAYLFVGNEKGLSPEARGRLEVLQSLDDLGIGFRLALQDMEIRGAGNLLGKDQSGQVGLVGFELYSKILKTVVKQIQSQTQKQEEDLPSIEPDIKIGFPAHIPVDYLPDVSERLLLYQRLVIISSRQEGMEILEEIEDRFGHPPEEVIILLELMIFRSILRRALVTVASYRNHQLSLTFHPQACFGREKLIDKVIKSQGAINLSPAMVLSIQLPALEVDSPIILYDYLDKFFKEIDIKYC
ncbi:MAG: transcription-repair coupling factor [Deltaproteobacteria bacterium]|nr:transcription-repair coupling factor [Deltaproteobacteria bacterium]